MGDALKFRDIIPKSVMVGDRSWAAFRHRSNIDEWCLLTVPTATSGVPLIADLKTARPFSTNLHNTITARSLQGLWRSASVELLFPCNK